MIDALHSLDIGCTQEILGSLFWEFIVKSPLAQGRTQDLRRQCLWALILEYYSTARPTTKLNGLTMEMVRRDGSKARLRAKAAETRHLLPFGVDLAQKMVDADPSRHNSTVFNMVKYLYSFYMSFGSVPFNVEYAQDVGMKRLRLYSDLSREAIADDFPAWAMKPKFHLFGEMILFQLDASGDPSLVWTYCDEDWVGKAAKLAHSRGGPRTASTSPLNVLRKFRGADLCSR